MATTARAPDFRRALLERFRQAELRGLEAVEVRCGDLHDEVNPHGRSPAVCSTVMWVETTAGNCEVLYSPPSGAGTRLQIRYGLPRRPSRFGGPT